MTQYSIFWNTGTAGDGTAAISEAKTLAFWNDILTPHAALGANPSQGVLRGVLGGLAVTKPDPTTVRVASGAAVAGGFAYRSDANEDFTIPLAPVGSVRYDIIVLRVTYDPTIRTVRLARVEGVADPSPTYPFPIESFITQIAGVMWDIPLAIVAVGSVSISGDPIDARVFAEFATNHVKRTGDNMTGALTINSAAVWTDAMMGNLWRQGDSATNWRTPGTAGRSPAAFRIQVGIRDLSAGVPAIITYPSVFSNVPFLITNADVGDISSELAASFTATSAADLTLRWLAIGPI